MSARRGPPPVLNAAPCLASGLPGQRVDVAVLRVAGRVPPTPFRPREPCRDCGRELRGTPDEGAPSGRCMRCLMAATRVGVAARTPDRPSPDAIETLWREAPACVEGRRRHSWSPPGPDPDRPGCELRTCVLCGVRRVSSGSGSRPLFAVRRNGGIA